MSIFVLNANHVIFSRAAQFGPNVLVDDSPANTYEPAIAVDSNGKLHTVWQDTRSGDYDIYYSNSADGGATWSPGIRVDNAFPGQPSYDPSIAVDTSGGLYDGNIYVVLHDARNGDSDIFVSTSTDGGLSWSADVRVDNAPVIVTSSRPSIAVDDGGVAYVVWDDYRSGSNQIYISRSNDGGNTWNPDVQVSAFGVDGSSPSIATYTSGIVYTAWHEYDGSSFSILCARSVDNGDTWSSVHVATGASYRGNVDIAVDDNENIYLAWIDEVAIGNAPVYFSSSSTQGSSWTPKTRVDDCTGAISGLSPRIGVNPASVLVVWADNRNIDMDIFFSESKDGGITWGDGIMNNNDIRINDNPVGDGSAQSQPDIAVGDWDIYAVWSDRRSVTNTDIYFAHHIISLLWITEFQDSPDGNELIELYCYGGKVHDLTGYYLSPDGGATQWSLTPLGTISPGEYRTIGDASGNLIIPTLDLNDEGGTVSLHDSTGTLVDEVGYGQLGTAPDPLSGESTARYWAGSAYLNNWTREPTPTFGAQNDVPPINIVPQVVLNEVMFFPDVAAHGFVELMYIGTTSININNYKIVCDTVYTIPAVTLDSMDAYFVLGYADDPGFFGQMTSGGDNVYLYDATGKLLDMVGWNSAHIQNRTVSRVPDGNGTYQGYDDASSGAAGWVFGRVASIISLLWITEFQDSPDGSELIEIFYYGIKDFDITGYYLLIDGATVDLTPLGTLSPGEYRSIGDPPSADLQVPITLGDEGGTISFYNYVGVLFDEVRYGQYGTAPDPMSGESTAKYWDGVTYQNSWSMTLPGLSTPTFGAQNNVPDIEQNPPLVLNEVCFNPSPTCNGYIELRLNDLNPLDFGLANHYIVVDSIYAISSGIMDPVRNLFFLNEIDYPLNFDMNAAGDNVYLYNSNGRLLDMVGWSSAHTPDKTMAREPEGSGGHDGYDDASSINAGWVFDSTPTYDVITIKMDQKGGGFPGENVTYSLNVTNLKFDTDIVNLKSTQQLGWPLTFYDSTWKPLQDTEPDGYPDITIGPVATQMLYVNISIPFFATDEIENVTINATSTTTSGFCPPGFDMVKLRTDVYPHLNVTKIVTPAQIYLNGTGLIPEEATVTLNLTGRGVAQASGNLQDIMFVLDSSGSMSGNDPDPDNTPCNMPFPQRVQASWNYIDNLTGGDRGGYVDFDSSATLKVPLAMGTSADDYVYLKQDLINGIWCSDQSGGTAFTPPLTVANNELINNGNPTHTWAEILLTDGEAGDHASAEAQADIAAANNIFIFTIGLSVPPGGAAENFLKTVASKTGGKYFSAPDASALESIFNEIGLSVKNLAAADPNPGDPLSPVIVDITPGYIDVDPSSINPGPPGLPFIDIIVNPDGTTELLWKIDKVLIGESMVFSYKIRSNQLGTGLNVTDWPNAAVTYSSWNNQSVTLSIPSAFIDVIGLGQPDLIPGNLPVPTDINVDGFPATGAIGSPAMSDQINVGIDTIHSISAIATNIGVGGTGVNFNITFCNCTSTGAPLGTPFLETAISPLAPSSSSPVVGTDWLAPSIPWNDYYVCIKVDSNGDVGESDETNNLYVIHFYTTTEYPDLIPGNVPMPLGIEVSATQLADAIGSPPMSENLTVGVCTSQLISTNVTNIGNGTTGSNFGLTFYNCTDTGVPVDPPFFSTTLGPLGAGMSSPTVAKNWLTPSIPWTDFYLCIEVDSNDDVNESDESNNLYIIHFYTTTDYPDLIPVNIEINSVPYSSPVDVAVGQTVQIKSRVENIGAVSNTVNFYYAISEESSPTPLFNVSVGIIPPGGLSPVYITNWTAPLTPGMHTITFFADSTYALAELNEFNNNRTIIVKAYGVLEPPSPVISIDGDDIVLEWSAVSEASGYKVYGGESLEEINFNTTISGKIIGTNWIHTNGNKNYREYYYVIRSVDTRGWEGPSSGIIGKYTKPFPRGYSTFSLPLEPFTINKVSWYTADMPLSGADTIYRYDSSYQKWIGHPKLLPEGVDDFYLVMGEGYMLFAMEPFNYTFTGRPGTTVRFTSGTSQDPRIGTEGAFRASLHLEKAVGGIRLTWSTPDDVDLGTLFQPYETAASYNIYRAVDRAGFDFANPYASTTDTSYIDTNANGSEYYYMVVPVNALGREGSSTYSAGIIVKSYLKGYSSFGLELRMEETTRASWFIGEGESVDTFYYYDIFKQMWIGHPKLLPESVDNPLVSVSEGYMVFVENELKVTIIGR